MASAQIINYYEMFGLDRSWTEKELKKKLGQHSVELSKMASCTNPNNREEYQRQKETAQHILDAISILGRPERRKEYDRQLDVAIKAGTAVYAKTQEVKDTLEKARRFFEQQNYEFALKFAQEALDLHANSDEPFEIKTKSLLMLGEYEEAIRTIDTGTEAFQSSVNLWWLRVRIYIMLEQYEKAQAELNQACRIFPGSAQFAAEQVYLYFHAGKDDAGKRVLDEYLRNHPEDVQYRQYTAYNLIDIANMYYRFDSEAQIMLISEEADYKECLKLVTLANSCYQDEYTKNELQRIQELGIESFDADRKFLLGTYKVLSIIGLAATLLLIIKGNPGVGILCAVITVFFFWGVRIVKRCCTHPQWYYYRDYYRGFKSMEDNALFSLVVLPFDLMADFFAGIR